MPYTEAENEKYQKTAILYKALRLVYDRCHPQFMSELNKKKKKELENVLDWITAQQIEIEHDDDFYDWSHDKENQEFYDAMESGGDEIWHEEILFPDDFDEDDDSE